MSILHDPTTPWHEDAKRVLDNPYDCPEDGYNGHWVATILRAALAEREELLKKIAFLNLVVQLPDLPVSLMATAEVGDERGDHLDSTGPAEFYAESLRLNERAIEEAALRDGLDERRSGFVVDRGVENVKLEPAAAVSVSVVPIDDPRRRRGFEAQPGPLPCKCEEGSHPNHNNYSAGAAERNGRTCRLGWPIYG